MKRIIYSSTTGNNYFVTDDVDRRILAFTIKQYNEAKARGRALFQR